MSGSTAAEGAAGTRLVDRLSVRAGYGPVVERCSAAITWSMTWLPRWLRLSLTV
ncbi:MAG: hypothetical protein ACLU37_02935 [Collinsella sp.]